MEPKKPAWFSSHLLWDVDPDTVDPEEHAEFLLPRIMDRGSMQDVLWAWEFYSEERIRECLMNAPTLQKKTIWFFSTQFEIPRESFRAWRQQNERWSAV